MFIAHLPAGYLAARLACRRFNDIPRRGLMLAEMAGGVFTDIDLVYATFADGPRIHHHLYWTHLPVIWLCFALPFYPITLLAGERVARHRRLAGVFLLGVGTHLILDSVAGDIWWLWPWVDEPFSLVHIPAAHSPWWLNYLLHWTFGLELAIVTLVLAWEAANPVLGRWNRRFA